jgi:hypothetical protein
VLGDLMMLLHSGRWSAEWAKMNTRLRWCGAPTSLALNIPHDTL